MRASAARVAGRNASVLRPAPRRIASSQVVRSEKGASQLLEAFYYGRAFAITLNRRVSEAATDILAEISKLIAENPTRLQEFQDEVTALVREELPGQASSAEPKLPAASASPSAAAASNAPAPDLEAIVDDLRAEVAHARAVLQEIKGARAELQ